MLDCLTCGACCREAFDAVPIEDDDDGFAHAHPELLHVADDGYRRRVWQRERWSEPRKSMEWFVYRYKD